MFGLLLGNPIMIMAQETAMLKAKEEFQKIEQAIRQATYYAIVFKDATTNCTV